MLYNFKNNFDCIKATERLKYLIKNEKKVELTEKKPIRSLSQNSYLHLILSYFALETGYTPEEVKQEIFKKIVNSDLFYNGEVNNKLVVIQRWRSTADLDSKEMTIAIDKFRDYAAINLGLYLPEPNDLAAMEELEKEIINQKKQI